MKNFSSLLITVATNHSSRRSNRSLSYLNFDRYFGSREGAAFIESASSVNVKRTWTDYGAVDRDWASEEQGAGEEFLYQATQCKNVWLTMGDIFAN